MIYCVLYSFPLRDFLCQHISISATGHFISTVGLDEGTYHSSALSLAKQARKSSICVGVGRGGLLMAAHDSCIWTESLRSCFPVVFKFKNGDIGLLHSVCTINNNIDAYLERDDFEEIQIFEKEDCSINTAKVRRFTQMMLEHFTHTAHPPAINVRSLREKSRYGVVVCYKSASGKPVILIGDSTQWGRMASRPDECEHKLDIIRPYGLTKAALHQSSPRYAEQISLFQTRVEPPSMADAYKAYNAADLKEQCCIIL